MYLLHATGTLWTLHCLKSICISASWGCEFKSSIAQNDLQVKVKAAKRFIDDGDKIKLTLQYKGRENANKEYYKKSLLEFIVLTEDFAIPESIPRDEGNKCIVILKPKK